MCLPQPGNTLSNVLYRHPSVFETCTSCQCGPQDLLPATSQRSSLANFCHSHNQRYNPYTVLKGNFCCSKGRETSPAETVCLLLHKLQLFRCRLQIQYLRPPSVNTSFTGLCTERTRNTKQEQFSSPFFYMRKTRQSCWPTRLFPLCEYNTGSINTFKVCPSSNDGRSQYLSCQFEEVNKTSWVISSAEEERAHSQSGELIWLCQM